MHPKTKVLRSPNSKPQCNLTCNPIKETPGSGFLFIYSLIKVRSLGYRKSFNTNFVGRLFFFLASDLMRDWTWLTYRLRFKVHYGC